jgi:hypothetical protein
MHNINHMGKETMDLFLLKASKVVEIVTMMTHFRSLKEVHQLDREEVVKDKKLIETPTEKSNIHTIKQRMVKNITTIKVEVQKTFLMNSLENKKKSIENIKNREDKKLKTTNLREEVTHLILAISLKNNKESKMNIGNNNNSKIRIKIQILVKDLRLHLKNG